MTQNQTGLIQAPSLLQGAWFKAPASVRDLKGLPAVLARAGSLELRLATTKREIRRAQRLRYSIFFEQGDAIPDPYKASLGRDKCPFDKVCDHLLVVETDRQGGGGKATDQIVGTYRLLRSDVAHHHHGFYSEAEFELDPLLERQAGKRLLELGRSCVDARFRSRRVIDLLWTGIGLYAAHHRIDALIGCASLPGTNADALATPLSFAFHHAAAPVAWQVGAIPPRAVRMDRLERSAIDPRHAMATLPPLMKAYVRAGATFASEAAVDHAFGTTDLFTVLPLASADPRYIARFGASA